MRAFLSITGTKEGYVINIPVHTVSRGSPRENKLDSFISPTPNHAIDFSG
jgi:hypothetical protein